MAETSKNKIYYNDNENSVADVLTDMKKMAESTDEAIEKSKYNDAAIKKSISDVEKNQVEKNIEQDSKIVELQTEKAKLETELKEMQEDFYQNSIRGQASGEYIHVEDSNNCRAKIGISGNSEQETRSGKNKYNGNDFTRGGWAVSFTNLTNLVNSLAVGDYTISFDVEIASITKEDTRSYLSQISYTTEDVLPKKDYSLTFPAKNVGSKVHFSFQINITNETAGKYSFILYTMGNHSVGPCGSSTYKNIQVELGTQETSYEQYGASPSPDYLSEIESVGSNGSVKVTKCNKNIMPIKIGDEWQYTTNGIKNLKQNSGSEITKFNVSKGQNIKIGFQLFSRPSQDATFVIYFNDLVQVDINLTHINNSFYFDLKKIYERNYIPNKDGTISIKLWGNGNADIFEFQLWAELDNLTDYVQHKEQSYIMPVQQEMLQGDYFDFDNEEEVHIWNKLVLTGDEEIMYSIVQGDYYLFQIRKNDAMRNIPFVCNKFINALNWGVANSRESINNQYNSGTLMQFKVLSSRLSETSANGVKLWLKAQYDAGMPVIVYYKLQTPTRLAFTDEQKAVAKELTNARTYKNVTNITTDSKAILSLDYAKDLETLLNNTQALAVNNASEGV